MTQKTVIHISGMTCAHCEKRVTGAIRRLKGIRSVKASFPKRRAEVQFDPDKTDTTLIRQAIEQEGYRVTGYGESKQPLGKVAPVFLIIIALYFILRYTVGFDFLNMIPRIDSTVSLLALFVTGLLTSVHCIAMCGGINLSQSVGTDSESEGRLKKPLLYNLGRVVSYTVVGAAVGGIGSVLFVSQTVKGIIMLVAAVFMIFMSLSMLGWLPWWLVPRLPASLSRRARKAGNGKGPLVVGLLNGLLPCGPLQSMQLYALSTGSVVTGALSMMLFALGTVPLMLGAGLIFSILKGRFTRAIMRVSAVLVMLIGFVMVLNAGNLFGWTNSLSAADTVNAGAAAETKDELSPVEKAVAQGYVAAAVEDGIQVVEAELTRSRYPSIVVQKGIPVSFNIKAAKGTITGCNHTVVFPAFDVAKQLEEGDNIISFMPEQMGAVSYTCWMGMLSGRILVVDSLAEQAAVQGEAATQAAEPVASEPPYALNQSACTLQNLSEEDITVAQVKGNTQVMTVKVDNSGYWPAILVVKRGVPLTLRFDGEAPSYCNSYIVFPDVGVLDIANGETEVEIVPEDDMVFSCGIGMLAGYIKVVDDFTSIDTAAILDEAVQSQTEMLSGGCCG